MKHFNFHPRSWDQTDEASWKRWISDRWRWKRFNPWRAAEPLRIFPAPCGDLKKQPFLLICWRSPWTWKEINSVEPIKPHGPALRNTLTETSVWCLCTNTRGGETKGAVQLCWWIWLNQHQLKVGMKGRRRTAGAVSSEGKLWGWQRL